MPSHGKPCRTYLTPNSLIMSRLSVVVLPPLSCTLKELGMVVSGKVAAETQIEPTRATRRSATKVEADLNEGKESLTDRAENMIATFEPLRAQGQCQLVF